MTIDDKIRDEKLQYDINREAANISALSSGKIDTYEYFACEENYLLIKEERWNELILHILHQEKLLKKKIEEQGKKQIKAIEDHGKQSNEFNELIKKDFNIGKDSNYLMNKKII